MSLTLGAVMALAQQCAPTVALEALVPQLQVESHFDPLAIGINDGPVVRARSLRDAVSIASRYIRAGYSVDLGLAQINSRNLGWLGISLEQAFIPCTSLRAASVVLIANYDTATATRSGIDAINATWSLYNSGSATRGIRNGYVGKVWTAANDLVPRMRAILGKAPSTATAEAASSLLETGGAMPPLPSSAPPSPGSWFYGPANADAIVFKDQ